MSNMVVQTNVLALNSHRYMKQVGQAQSKASARLSSGYKINSAADDAAGLAISEKMRAQIRGLDQASKNSQDAISLIQTAEGGMQEIDNMLQRIRELVVSVSNDTNENNTEGTGDRQKIQDEIDQLVAEIDSMSERVEFNKKKVINGSYADTALQLKNAKAEYDRSSLGKVETNAKLSAYKDALGVTGDTANATGTTAYSRLNAAQDAVDAGVTPYKDALKAFTAAEVTYTEAQKAYQTTYRNMETALSDVNKEADEITDTMLDKTNAAYLGDDFARAFTAYQEASNAWGIEGLGFDTANVTAANVLTGKTFTGAASADSVDLATARTAQQDYADALAAAMDVPEVKAFLERGGLALKTAYEDTLAAFKTALTDANLAADASTLTGQDLLDNKTLASAMEAYVNAADAYGIDDLDILNQPIADEVALTSTYKLQSATTTATGYASAFNALKASSESDKADTLDAIETYLTTDVGSAFRTEYEEAKKNLGSMGITSTDLGTLVDSTYVSAITDSDVADALIRYANAAEAYGLDELLLGNGANATGSTDFAGLIAEIVLQGTISYSGTDLSAVDQTYADAQINNPSTAAALFQDIADLSGSLTNAAADIKTLASAGVTTAANVTSMISAWDNYEGARDDANLATALTTTNRDIVENTTPAVSQALADYVTYADAWGYDGKDLATNKTGYAAVGVAAKYIPDATTTTTARAASAADLYAQINSTDLPLVQDVIDAKATLDSFGAYAAYKLAQEDFTAAEAVYNDLVAKRDNAQTTVNDLTTNVSNTEKEKLRSDILYNVASQKLDTAKNAVEADDSQALYFQVGANATQGLEMSIGSVKSDVLGIGDGNGVTNIDVVKDTGLDTTALLDVLDTALSYVTTERSRLGAAQNRLEYTIKSLDISSENLSAAESRIRDTDMAKEMMELTKANTLQQASISMLAQANQAPQSVLQLLG